MLLLFLCSIDLISVAILPQVHSLDQDSCITNVCSDFTHVPSILISLSRSHPGLPSYPGLLISTTRQFYLSFFRSLFLFLYFFHSVVIINMWGTTGWDFIKSLSYELRRHGSFPIIRRAVLISFFFLYFFLILSTLSPLPNSPLPFWKLSSNKAEGGSLRKVRQTQQYYRNK